MAVTEEDVELLEMYLDGALETAESAEIRRRLSEEPPLAATLDDLRSQRAMRAAVWKAMEPLQPAAEQLSWRIRGVIADRNRSESRRFGVWSTARIGSVAAACIALGFFVGWTGRGNRSGPAVSIPQTGSAVAMSQPAAKAATPGESGLVVPVTDEYGRVVAFQRFQNLDDAQKFSEDLHHVQGTESAAQGVKLISDEQY